MVAKVGRDLLVGLLVSMPEVAAGAEGSDVRCDPECCRVDTYPSRVWTDAAHSAGKTASSCCHRCCTSCCCCCDCWRSCAAAVDVELHSQTEGSQQREHHGWPGVWPHG